MKARAEKWSQKNLLESARAYCANSPEKGLYQVADTVVEMVLGI